MSAEFVAALVTKSGAGVRKIWAKMVCSKRGSGRADMGKASVLESSTGKSLGRITLASQRLVPANFIRHPPCLLLFLNAIKVVFYGINSTVLY